VKKDVSFSVWVWISHFLYRLYSHFSPQLRQEFEGTGITVMKDGHLVSRQSDWILYSVPAEFIDAVVATYGPCMMGMKKKTPLFQNPATL
jgi:hypothetical protein